MVDKIKCRLETVKSEVNSKIIEKNLKTESTASGNQNSATGLLFFHPFFLFSPLTPIHSNSAFGHYSANTGCLLSPSALLF